MLSNMKIKKYITQNLLPLFAAGLLLTSILSCAEEDIPNNVAPRLEVQNATNVLRTSAILSGTIAGETANLKDFGFNYSISKEFPDDDNTKTVSMKESGETTTLSTLIKDLTPDRKYYYRMYATTGASTVFSEPNEFQTPTMSPPTIGEMITDSIGENYARFKFNIEDIGNEVLIECGVGYKKGDSKTFIPVASEVMNQNQYVIEITGLEPDMEYNFRPYAKNAADVDATTGSIEGYGSTVTRKTEALLSAKVETVVIASGNIGINSVKVVGKVLSAEGSKGEITDCGFVWSTTIKSPTVDLNDGATSVNPQYDVLPFTFNADITGLEQSTSYYICAFAKNIVDGKERVAYGEVREFSTLGLNTPKLSFTYEKNESGYNVYNYDRTATTIQVKAYITNYDGPACWEKGIIWSKTDAGVTIDKEPKNKIPVLSNDHLINGTIKDLELGTSYYVRVYAIYKAGENQTIGYTDAENCYTESFNTPALSGVVINNDKITYKSAELTGKISSPGNGKITERGFVMSVASKTTSPTLDNCDMIVKSDESFITVAKELKPSTEYAVRSYVKCELGTKKETVYSWYSSFFTRNIEWPTFNNVTCNEESKTFNSLEVTSGIASLGNATLVEKGFCWLENTNTYKEVTLESCTGSKKVDTGIQTEYSYKITGLKANTHYNVRAYAKVTLDGKTSTVYSYTNGFGTKIIQMPSIENFQYSTDATSITASASITEQGDATITEVGFCCIATDKGNNPTVKDIFVSQKFNFDSDSKDISLILKNLVPGTSYYVNVFAKMKLNSEELIHYVGTYWANTYSLGVDNVSYTPVSTTCEVSAKFTDNTCSEYGFVWIEKTDKNIDITPEQATGKLKCTNMDTDYKFSGTIKDLTGGKAYYLWTYAVYSGKTIYNGRWEFATKRAPGQGDNVSPDKK